MQYKLTKITPTGEVVETIDLTDPIGDAVEAAGALAVATRQRMADYGETTEDALERLTANYGRAEIEQSGFEALQDLFRHAGIAFEQMPSEEYSHG